MFKLNLKIALRNLWKNKGFSVINIGGLAIGLACCLMLMLYVNYEWSYDKEIKDIDKVYFTRLNLKFNGKIATTGAVPNRLAQAVLREIPGIEYAARISESSVKLFSRNNNGFKLKSTYVDPSFLKIIDYHFIFGNSETALSEPNGLILTSTTAKRLFGDENPIGKDLKWDNERILTVTAVIEDLPKNQSIQFEILQPWAFLDQIDPDDKNNGWGGISCATVVKLKESASVPAINASLKDFIVNKQADLKPYVYQPFLFPLSKTHLYGKFENGVNTGGRIDEVKLFLFLAVCVLFIACINYMNLSTARSEKRAREVGVRKALGSGRRSLMGQFMVESLLISFIAMLIAIALLEVSLPYFNNLLAITITIDYQSYLFWLTLLGLVLITGLLAGSYPAFYLSSFIPVKVLKGFKGTVGSLSIRRVLVVVQFSLSVCMIISAIVVYNQIQFLKNKPLGFDKDNMVQLDLEGELRNAGKLELLKMQLKNQGAILSATEYASSFTDGGSITSDISWPGKAANDRSIIAYKSVGFNFSNTIGAKIVTGRDFSPKFPADTTNAVLLNETAVKLMGFKEPIGSIIKWDDNPPLHVVGVIKDYFSESLGAKVDPTIYYYNVNTSSVLLMRLNPNQSVGSSVALIKRISEKINPAYPAEITFVSQGMAEKLRSEQLLGVLSNFFGGFAIFISCLGLLGLALYMAEQRSKEISIRKVLGANLQDILVLLNKDFLKLVIISNIVAIPVAYVLVTNWLQKYDYKTTVTYWPFILAILTSLIIAIITVSLQTFKLAKSNAVDALKYE